MNRRTLWFCFASFLMLLAPYSQANETLVVGSKNFTEQEILGELIAQLIEAGTSLQVERRFGLGGTGICHSALLAGELDIYVEYTGTALLDVLKQSPENHPDIVFQVVEKAYRQQYDLMWLPPIGFNNTYTITVRASSAQGFGWDRISDVIRRAPKLTAGFTSEFMVRPDGYPGLRRTYRVEFGKTMDMDPGLMYAALADGQVDAICAFSTDGRIVAYDLRTLQDDRAFFPPYDAAPVIRGDVLRQYPQIRASLTPVAGTIRNEDMQKMNYAVDELGQSPADVASRWIQARAARSGIDFARERDVPDTSENGLGAWFSAVRGEVLVKTVEHLKLTGLAMLIAIVFGVLVGILIHRARVASGPVLGLMEIVQTVPSLAMLAFLFAVYRMLGPVPAVTALVLYALLPIVLNTYTGLKEVSPTLIEAANGLGFSGRQRLLMVEIPLALPVMIAGIRTATVWTVGIATLSTYIGAGGLGDFISRGLARNDARLTLLGAIPAALIAIALSYLIRCLERRLK